MVLDIIIWILLFTGAGFGLVGLIGLFLFPDTRSRMYTAVRATLIGISSVALAVIIYGLNGLQTSDGDIYLTLVMHTFILVVVVAAGTSIVSRIILEKTHTAVEKPVPKRNKK
jgi:multisubunit Na+/H+ antiporter MnhG subunit